jgi:hypothetical protein
MTKAQEALMAKHGAPEEFERAVWEAYCNLFITHEEAEVGIAKYREEWAEAGRAGEAKREDPQDQAPDG